jgi:hypothetical protein
MPFSCSHCNVGSFYWHCTPGVITGKQFKVTVDDIIFVNHLADTAVNEVSQDDAGLLMTRPLQMPQVCSALSPGMLHATQHHHPIAIPVIDSHNSGRAALGSMYSTWLYQGTADSTHAQAECHLSLCLHRSSHWSVCCCWGPCQRHRLGAHTLLVERECWPQLRSTSSTARSMSSTSRSATGWVGGCMVHGVGPLCRQWVSHSDQQDGG